MIGLYIGLGIAFVFVVLIGIVLIRTISFRPLSNQKQDEICNEVNVDKDKIVNRLCELVRCKTVSYTQTELEDDAEFEKLISLLPSLYPEVFKMCTMTRFPDRGLLFRWKGRDDTEASVMMAHYDVVPVEEENWKYPPFDAVVAEECIWGRGTLDTKVTVNGILSAAEQLITEGFTPEHDIYFAFSGGEEVGGRGAKNIVEYFSRNNINIQLVSDEGGAVVENVFPGVKGACGMVGIAEKNAINVEYFARSRGGHASAPKPHTPIGLLSDACCKIEANPFKSHLTEPVRQLFDTLGRHSSFVYRMIFANLWLFYPVLDRICIKSGGEINALLRTTVAFTQMSGSKASNVIPPSASMVSNIRLNPDDTAESALEYLKKTINNDEIELRIIDGNEPSIISRTDCKSWDKVVKAVKDTWNGCLVSPYLMVQCSDSRHYSAISDKVYRFSAMDLTSEERASIHGDNEHIRIECACKAVEFYIRLMSEC